MNSQHNRDAEKGRWERNKCFNWEDSSEEEVSVIKGANYLDFKVDATNEGEKHPPLFIPTYFCHPLPAVCVRLPDKGHFQGVFGVLLETAGTGTRVRLSTLPSPC